jgi:deazaflavin-dependent oxidoreductase (nitroreductase family)
VNAFRTAASRVLGTAWFRRVGPHFLPAVDRRLSRLTKGRLMVGVPLAPSIMLITTGSVTGQPRTTPLLCTVEPDGSMIVAASNFGRDTDPHWAGNLRRTPQAAVVRKGVTIPVLSRELADEQYSHAWKSVTDQLSFYSNYAEVTERPIPLFQLTPHPTTPA